MTEFGIAVFDIDLKPAENAVPQDAINLVALYGPYSTKSDAEDYQAFVEREYRERYAERYNWGRYEFKLEVMPLQTAPVLQEGWL
jgi:hypothetical protein